MVSSILPPKKKITIRVEPDHFQDSEFRSFFARIVKAIIFFRDCLTLNTLPRNELLCQLFGGLRYQLISYKIKVWQPWLFTVNSAHFGQFLGKWAKLTVLFS